MTAVPPLWSGAGSAGKSAGGAPPADPGRSAGPGGGEWPVPLCKKAESPSEKEALPFSLTFLYSRTTGAPSASAVSWVTSSTGRTPAVSRMAARARARFS